MSAALIPSSADPDAVSVVVDGVAWGGWETISITRGIESVPSAFEMSGTERYPGQVGGTMADILVTSPCTVKIGADTIVTGYVDCVDREVTPQSHEIRLTGRSKFSDLVDCSGFTNTHQFSNLTLLNIATTLGAPFGITASAPDGDTAPIPAISVVVTETVFEFLEEVSRWLTKLVYDDVNGNIVIANVGTNTHSSGIVEGQNAQSFSGTMNASERFTTYSAVYSDTAILGDGGTDFQYAVQNGATDTTFEPRADGSARFRPMVIVAEQGPGYDQVVIKRVTWEAARRFGRSQVVNVTVDTWRDSSGTLWTPNWLVPVNLPSVKFPNITLLITNVQYLKDDQGSRAVLTLMPPAAVAPMPQVPYGYSPALASASSGQTGAQTSPTSSS